jgi:hypothetical protein
MNTIIHTLRIASELLLVLPLLPVIGMMWLAKAVTNEPPDNDNSAPRPVRLPPPLPQRPATNASRPMPRYVKRQWRRRRNRLLTRLVGQGDFVTDWQLR